MTKEQFETNKHKFRDISSKKQLIEELKILLKNNTNWFNVDNKNYLTHIQLEDIVNNFLTILKYPLNPIQSGVYKLTLTNIGTFYLKFLPKKRLVINLKEPRILPDRYIPSFMISQTAKKQYKAQTFYNNKPNKEE